MTHKLEFMPLTGDQSTWPPEGRVVLVALKRSPEPIRVGHGHEGVSLLPHTVFPATLAYVKDGFGTNRPLHWAMLALQGGKELDEDEDAPRPGPAYRWQVTMQLVFGHVVGWAAVEPTV